MMRSLVLALLVVAGSGAGTAGCATTRQPDPTMAPAEVPSQAAADPVQMRACESCRQNLELCRRPTTFGDQSCGDQFMLCLKAQSLEPGQCAGLN
jgi:hypothetical protein